MAALLSSTIGYPRIGKDRAMKRALERYWRAPKAPAALEELMAASETVERQAWMAQADAGVDLIGLDGTLYDQVLDFICILGLAPPRFAHLSGVDLYFALARGTDSCGALDMSKYFNTNYHFMVPEISHATQPALHAKPLLSKVSRGQAVVGKQAAVPMVLGPVTMARIAKLEGTDIPSVVAKLQPLYEDLLKRLKDMGVPEVQMLEPALCVHDAEDLRAPYGSVYAVLGPILPLNLVTFYDDVGTTYAWVKDLPVAAISLDFVGVLGAATPCRTLQFLQEQGFPSDKRLGAGVIDGRNVWANRGQAEQLLADIKAAGVTNVCVQTSCSLQHVPLSLAPETELPDDVKAELAFAAEKLAEVGGLARAGQPSGEVRRAADVAVPPIPRAMFDRTEPFAVRRTQQTQVNPKIPTFPTTTIGSFPQTADIRKMRLAHKRGAMSEGEYRAKVDAHIAYMIGVQEGIGLDVLVHGEPERSDMVEFFGQYLEGLCFTLEGWVQSYGSRYVRPPVIVSDVSRPAAMTVREFKVAQACTDKPVKGMLTGPVTVLNWSFPRANVPRSTQALQLALALRQEVADLEAAGCTIIQVDEPALREGLPLKRDQWDAYLGWAVDAFRLTAGVAGPATQIVTHLCYSDFNDILGAIDRMDADVLTIENSRSGDEMIRALAAAGYGRDMGPGVYDVHSPAVPSVEFMRRKIASFQATGMPVERIWVNPDCGLKTRAWKEVVPALRNMVAAAQELRDGDAGCGLDAQQPGAAAAMSHAVCCGGGE